VWLKRFFVLHFLVDILFAVPLFFWPQTFLSFFDWQVIDPVAARLVAAALFGIGIESFLGRSGTRESFKAMLNLKIIWSLAAIGGILLSLKEVEINLLILVILITFIGFNLIWIYWRWRLAG
jgi:hypothetical protein